MFCRPDINNGPIGGKWNNWSENLVHHGRHGQKYIYFPKNWDELKDIILEAKSKGIKVRASGQRHSQPPLVIHDNRDGAKPVRTKVYIIDMSLYQDMAGGTERMEIVDQEQGLVKVNAGTREDEFDTFLAENNLALQTVTAGGIFSIGGMTSNDVHGGSIRCGIFAETCTSFTYMDADGEEVTISEDDEAGPDGFKPIQFARVNLGSLGIVTSITVKCDQRPVTQSLQGRMAFIHVSIKEEFSNAFEDFVKHQRMECFYDPYVGGFLPLMWDLETEFDSVGFPNNPPPIAMDTVEHAEKGFYGAPLQGIFFKKGSPLDIIETLAEGTTSRAQYLTGTYHVGKKGAQYFVKTAMTNIATSQVQTAFNAYSEAWLQDAARCIFMSYFVELPNLGKEGLELTYDLLQVVTKIVNVDTNFHISGPMEFRFVKAGDSAMSGAYLPNSDATFVNLDLIGFVSPGNQAKKPENYPKAMLDFFATVEREWVAAGGLPHQGKMYGFYDPEGEDNNSCVPFNSNFIKMIQGVRNAREGAPVTAFGNYIKSKDPTGMFMNEYVEELIDV